MAWPTKTTFVDGDVLTAAEVNNIGTNLNLADPTGITDGYVLTADGSGSMGWEAVPSGGMTEIASGVLTGGTTTSITSIPGTYKDLIIYIRDVYDPSGLSSNLTFNSVTTTEYAYARFGVDNTSLRALTGISGTNISIVATTVATATTSALFAQIRIKDYASAVRQGVLAHCAAKNSLGQVQTLHTFGHFNSNTNTPSAITSVQINFSTTPDAGTYVLYGVK